MLQTITEIDDDTATVRAINGSEHGQLAAALLQAAGPGNARTVRTVSLKGGGRGFEVPTAVAYAAGLIPEEAEPEPVKKAPVKKAAPAKKAPAKAATDQGGDSDVE